MSQVLSFCLSIVLAGHIAAQEHVPFHVNEVVRAATPAPVKDVPAEPVPTVVVAEEVKAVPHLTYVGQGVAAHYHYGIMDTVAANRGYAPRQCQISYTEATIADIGRMLYVESQLPFKDGVHGAWCQIMDMPQAYDYASIKGRGIIVELGWAITPYLCGLSEPYQEPPQACPVIVYE